MSSPRHLHVSFTDATSLSSAQIARWQELRAANRALWSPFFDPRYVQLVARSAPRAGIAVVRQDDEIVGFLPLQGKPGGLMRPLGAPLADQHGLIAASDGPGIEAVMAALHPSSFRFTGLAGVIDPGLVRGTHDIFLADLSDGVDAYEAVRQAAYPDHFKKMGRRLRRAEREFGPVRLESGLRDRQSFDTLIAWKREKYRATGRHDILGVPWIVQFLQDLLASDDPDFCGEVSVLWFGDALAAIEFGMRAGDVLHSWFPSYDPRFSAVSPGVMLMDGMILQAGARGIRVVDLGSGHSEYKKYASNRRVEVVEGCLEGGGVRRLITAPAARLGHLVERANLGAVSALPGKLGRRLEMILAAEPTLAGRARGIWWAARDMTGRPG
jgi:CelD/BcsL family acetyltransferase involved in cellulose biosynthesis